MTEKRPSGRGVAPSCRWRSRSGAPCRRSARRRAARCERSACIDQRTQSSRARFAGIQASSPLPSSGACTAIQSPRWRTTPKMRGEPHSVRGGQADPDRPPGLAVERRLPVHEGGRVAGDRLGLGRERGLERAAELRHEVLRAVSPSARRPGGRRRRRRPTRSPGDAAAPPIMAAAKLPSTNATIAPPAAARGQPPGPAHPSRAASISSTGSVETGPKRRWAGLRRSPFVLRRASGTPRGPRGRAGARLGGSARPASAPHSPALRRRRARSPVAGWAPSSSRPPSRPVAPGGPRRAAPGGPRRGPRRAGRRARRRAARSPPARRRATSCGTTSYTRARASSGTRLRSDRASSSLSLGSRRSRAPGELFGEARRLDRAPARSARRAAAGRPPVERTDGSAPRDRRRPAESARAGRRGWDSNPRGTHEASFDGFHGRRVQPLCHPSLASPVARSAPRRASSTPRLRSRTPRECSSTMRRYPGRGSSRKGAPNSWSTSGMATLPSSRWWFSTIAMIVRPTATAVPFSVCTWRTASPSAGR